MYEFFIENMEVYEINRFFNPLWCFEIKCRHLCSNGSISLDLSNATCKEALDAIKKQTKLDFFYNNQEINAVGKVSVRCQNVSLDEALRQVLGKNFTFRIVDNTVVIRPQETKPGPRAATGCERGRCG